MVDIPELQRRLASLKKVFLEEIPLDDLDAADPSLLSDIVPLLDLFGKVYYRLEVEGLGTVPHGPAVVVINHNSGISFAELLGFGARWYLERGYDDILHGLAHDAMLKIPYLKNFLMHGGAVRASHRNADRVLERGRKILVAPGGNLEAFRPHRDRHRIQFAGRTGFLKAAIRHRAPIVPAVFIGGHDTFYVIDDGRFVVELLGLHERFRLDTFPLFLGLPWGIGVGPIFHLPLPVRCKVRILPPILLDRYDPGDAENPEVLQELYDLVTGHMQAALDEMAEERRR